MRFLNHVFVFSCLDGEYAHPYFALGWKAMEVGWYKLSHHLLDEAIRIDPNFYMAWVGKMLSNERMGYGLVDGKSYKDRMSEIYNSLDFKVKLSLQEQLLVQALSTFQNGSTYEEGLVGLIEVFSYYEGFKDPIIKVIEGNANLLQFDAYQILNTLAEDEKIVFALQLLTHNLNPYKNGKSRISLESRRAATDAVYHYQDLGIGGAWQITADCTDITEYYAEWKIGSLLLENQRIFVFDNISPDPSFLLGENQDEIFVHGLNVTYMSTALYRVNAYERLHFFHIQVCIYLLLKPVSMVTNSQLKWRFLIYNLVQFSAVIGKLR